MSWISGLADKAEQILTTIDQNAAVTLQKKKQRKTVEDTRLTEVTTESPEQLRPRVTPTASPTRKWVPQTRSSPNLTKQLHDEDKLIDFLNDGDQPVIQNHVTNDETKAQPRDEDGVNDEKMLLKNEVRVLNNELSLLLHRTRMAEKEAESLKTKLINAENSQHHLQEEVDKLIVQIKNLELRNEELSVEKKHVEKHQPEVESEEVAQLRQEMQILQEKEKSLIFSLQSKDRDYMTVKQLQEQETSALQQRVTELRAELDQYRVRAQRTLSDKEALISQLRANNSDDAVLASLHTELAQLREERQQLSEELAEAQNQVEVTRSNVVEGEQALAHMREVAAAARQELTELATTEAHRRRILEDDCHLQTQELRLVREELAVCRGQLSLCEAELRNRPLTPPTAPPPLPRELEHRLSSLTKTLIHKQTALESATMECNQLRMQVEELEHKHREQLMSLHQTRILGANDTDDAKAQVPSFLVESPLDTGVTRRVKRAYSSLDAVSIRTGVFLRRYPLARIFVVLYVVVLHSLMLTVLYSRTPDNTPKFTANNLS